MSGGVSPIFGSFTIDPNTGKPVATSGATGMGGTPTGGTTGGVAAGLQTALTPTPKSTTYTYNAPASGGGANSTTLGAYNPLATPSPVTPFKTGQNPPGLDSSAFAGGADPTKDEKNWDTAHTHTEDSSGATKVDLWGMEQQAIQDAAQKSAQSIGAIQAESGTIDQGYATAQNEATRTQAMMARKAAANSALMGASAGGGAAQAGGAQAALSGQGLQNQATEAYVGQKLDQAKQSVAVYQSQVAQQMDIAKQYMSGAMTQDAAAKAQTLYLTLQKMQSNIDILGNMVSSGQLTDPASVSAAYASLLAQVNAASLPT